MRQLKDLIKIGNTKIARNTAIFNMGPASNCPSRAKGLCKVCTKYGDNGCYALRPEQFRPQVLPYRKAQQKYWLSNDSQTIADDFCRVLDKKRNMPEYIRYNESGDFWNQKCISKLDTVAKQVKKHFSIITFGYSARADLIFKDVSFLVKSSGYDNGNNGKTTVLEKGQPCPVGYKVCPGINTCMFDCRLCASGYDIAFPKH